MIAYVVVAVLLVALVGLALSVRLSPLSPTVPVYAR